MHHSIYHNAKNDRQYKAATGLSRAEFDALYAHFDAFYLPKATPPTTGTNAPALTDKREALFFVLFAYKAYPTLQNLGLCFGISDACASRYLELLKPCLKTALRAQTPPLRRVFASQSAFDEAFQDVNDLFIDVTEIPVERAAEYDVQKLFYSGKKNSTP